MLLVVIALLGVVYGVLLLLLLVGWWRTRLYGFVLMVALVLTVVGVFVSRL